MAQYQDWIGSFTALFMISYLRFSFTNYLLSVHFIMQESEKSIQSHARHELEHIGITLSGFAFANVVGFYLDSHAFILVGNFFY